MLPWWNHSLLLHYDVMTAGMCDVGFNQKLDSQKSELNGRRDIPASSGFRCHILHHTGSENNSVRGNQGYCSTQANLIYGIHRAIYKWKYWSEPVPEPRRSSKRVLRKHLNTLTVDVKKTKKLYWVITWYESKIYYTSSTQLGWNRCVREMCT